jgi:hypothetical protein
LFIGVSDNGEIKGLERDFQLCKKKNKDGFEQKLQNLLYSSHFHESPWGKVNNRFEHISNLIVCAVDAQPLLKPKYVLFDGELHVREGNTTKKLEGLQFADWIQQRVLA